MGKIKQRLKAFAKRFADDISCVDVPPEIDIEDSNMSETAQKELGDALKTATDIFYKDVDPKIHKKNTDKVKKIIKPKKKESRKIIPLVEEHNIKERKEERER